MNIVVLGSGVVGVTTAYYLARRGHGVTVLEKASSAGQATSFANGGQLSYSYTDPLANPAILVKLPRLIAGQDPAFRIEAKTDPALLAWGLRFLRNCTYDRMLDNTRKVLRLALYSRQQLHQLLERHPIGFDYRQGGKLHLYAQADLLHRAKDMVALKNSLGCAQEVLDRAGCLAREPSLAHWRAPLAGGVYSPLDESGDAFTFTVTLAELLRKEYGVRFRYKRDVRDLVVRKGRISHVLTDRGEEPADAFVLCLGAHSPLLSRAVGLKLPVYPLKGYSLTVPAAEHAPVAGITDTRRKMVYSTLGKRLRIAGMAELKGYDDTLEPDRLNLLLDAARENFPGAGDYDRIFHKWTGFRPATPDSAPLLGTTPLPNLFLNSGQGMLGWTLACGSGAVVADVVDGQKPSIDLEGLTLRRYLGDG